MVEGCGGCGMRFSFFCWKKENRAWSRQDPADAHDARLWWGLVAYALRFGERPDPADAHDAGGCLLTFGNVHLWGCVVGGVVGV